jgi:hypothetical protein
VDLRYFGGDSYNESGEGPDRSIPAAAKDGRTLYWFSSNAASDKITFASNNF